MLSQVGFDLDSLTSPLGDASPPALDDFFASLAEIRIYVASSRPHRGLSPRPDGVRARNGDVWTHPCSNLRANPVLRAPVGRKKMAPQPIGTWKRMAGLSQKRARIKEA
jgi:hypothetical protein